MGPSQRVQPACLGALELVSGFGRLSDMESRGFLTHPASLIALVLVQKRRIQLGRFPDEPKKVICISSNQNFTYLVLSINQNVLIGMVGTLIMHDEAGPLVRIAEKRPGLRVEMSRPLATTPQSQ